VPQEDILLIEIAPRGTLCTLTLQTTDENEQTTKVVPLGRSYHNFGWESVAGPYSDVNYECDTIECRCRAPAKEVNDAFVLTTFSDTPNTVHSRSILDRVARFYEQSTFGITKPELETYNDVSDETSLDYRLVTWAKNQMQSTPATSLRALYRQQSSTRARTIKNIGVPYHVCDINTRWHSYAFTQVEGQADYGILEVSLTSDSNYYLFSINGVPRTEVNSVSITGYGDLTVPGNYPICSASWMEEFVGGQFQLFVDGQCRFLEAGNPAIQFLSSNPSKPQYVIDMTQSSNDLVNDFQSVPGTFTNEDFLLIQSLTHGNCSFIPLAGHPVYLDFRNGTYLSFDPRLDLLDNTVTDPLLDGGGGNHALGARCSNVPRTFWNEASCQLSLRNTTSTCSNEVAFTDVQILLSQDNLYTLFDLTSRYICAIAGLRVESSPCVLNSRSRWERVNESPSCPDGGPTEFLDTDSTGVTLTALLEDPNHRNFWLREITYSDTDQECKVSSTTPSNLTDITLIADGACWKLVHEDHYSVYDMTPWVSSHPGGAAKITQFAVPGGMILTYAHPTIMSRWETNKELFPLIGVFNWALPFRDLPSNLQLPSVIDHFVTSEEDPDNLETIMVCGSPNEVGNDPVLGETGLAMSINDDMEALTAGLRESQRGVIWTQVALTAPDQLRQRVAWALSQLFATSPPDVNEGEQSEGFLNYYDIFVRNAFGNYFDILKEVSYSPHMAEMLTYLKIQSTAYVFEKCNIVAFADENYAREGNMDYSLYDFTCIDVFEINHH